MEVLHMITNIPVAGVLKPGVFLNDLEILILMYEEKIILSDVEIKWRIGQRIAWEETLWKGYGGIHGNQEGYLILSDKTVWFPVFLEHVSLLS